MNGRNMQRTTCSEVERLKEGELEAMSFLYEKYSSMIQKFAMKYVECPTDASDVTQESFEIAMLKCTQLEDEHKFVAWLRGIAYRLSMMKLRGKYKECPLELALEQEVQTEDYYPKEGKIEFPGFHWVEKEVTYKELKKTVWDKVDELPDKLKEVVVAYYYEKRTLEEIAHSLKCPLGTVKSRIQKARKLMNHKYREDFLAWR